MAVKAGLNWSGVQENSAVQTDRITGYMIGGYISPKTKKILGFRSEIMLSRQGYDFRTSTSTGTVRLDYLLLPQLIVLKFTKKFQVQAGGQIAFLLNGRVDSSGNAGGTGSLLDYLERFDYGVAGGVEVSPLGGLFLGGRLNAGLKNLGKSGSDGGSNPGNYPGFIPKNLFRNTVLQIFIGWRF